MLLRKILFKSSLPSSRQDLSYDDCMEDKREDCQNCYFPVLCTSVVHSETCTHLWAVLTVNCWFMVALWKGADHIYYHAVVCSSFFFFSLPNLICRRLDVCHTSTHGVALVRISDAGLKLVLLSDSLSKIVEAGHLITWLSWDAWSVSADLFCSDRLDARWFLVKDLLIMDSTSVLCSFSLVQNFLPVSYVTFLTACTWNFVYTICNFLLFFILWMHQ